MTPDLAFTIEPTIVTTRFLFNDGHVVDVTHAHPDGSHVRELLLDEAVRQWGANDHRKIEGSTRLVVVSSPTIEPAKRTAKKAKA